MTHCWFCGSKMIWSNDFDFEDYGIFDKEGIVAVLSCSNEDCGTHAEFYQGLNKEDEMI